MGQYYQATILKKDYKSEKQPVEAWISSFDYGGNGMKLMEHSYRGNAYVTAFESLIDDKKGKYAGYPVVWAGDYADVEKGYEKENLNIYGLADNTKPLVIKDKMLAHRYIINLDKMEFVDMRKLPKADTSHYEDKNGKVHTVNWYIHPLPLLTCEGNGRGGGDYEGSSMELVGTWARDRVVVSNDKPDVLYKEIKPNFLENR